MAIKKNVGTFLRFVGGDFALSNSLPENRATAKSAPIAGIVTTKIKAPCPSDIVTTQEKRNATTVNESETQNKRYKANFSIES